MNLSDKDNNSLLRDLKDFVSEERRILNLILRYLREAERRKLHLEMGYSNLYVFCTKELGYSEASSHRRISAMRLIKEIPEVERKIQDGVLSLSVISQAQTHFRQNNSKTEYKKQLLQKLENKTSKESERLLLSLTPQVLPTERQKVIDQNYTEIRLSLNQKALEKLEQVRARLSHKNLSMAEIFEMGLDLLIDKNDASVPPMRSRGSNLRAQASTSRYIPRAIRAELLKRDGGMCQYRNPDSGKLCGSRFYLQFDHVTLLALGGKTELKNLRLLCSNHNKFMWERMQSSLQEIMISS